MGFMAGFGPAFADAFNAGNERRAKRKDDMFKLTYSEFLDRREKYEKKKEADSKLVGSAKTLARDLAGNEEYWPKVYDWLQSGMSESTILDLIQNGEFETAPTASPEVQDVGPPEEAQMVNSGLANPSAEMPAAQSDVAQMSSPQQQSTGMMDRLFPGFAQAKRDRDINGALDQVSQVSGMRRNEIDQIMKGTGNTVKTDSSGIIYKRKPTSVEPDKINTPEEAWIEQTHAQREYDLNPTATNEIRLQKANDRVKALKDLEAIKQEARARADAAKEGRAYGFFSAKQFDEQGNFTGSVLVKPSNDGYETESGQFIPKSQVQLWKEGEQDDYKAVAKATAKLGEDQIKKSSNTKELLFLGKDMSDIVAASKGNVLAQRTTNFTTLAVDWAQELTAISNILTDENVANDMGAEEKLANLDRTVQDLLGKSINDVTMQRALLDAKVKIFAYRLGMAMGQEGRSLAETERKVFEEVTKAGGSPEKFNQNIANLISDQIRSYETVSSDLNNYNLEVEAFQKLYGWKEPPFQTVPTFGQMMVKEPKLKEAYDYFKPFMTFSTQPNEENTTIINGAKIRKIR